MKNSLPDKPSELLEVALHDLELVEQNPLYEIDMSKWHSAGQTSKRFENGIVVETNTPCEVCLAGSVLAMSLEIPRDTYVDPCDLGDQVLHNKLLAIDQLRRGEIDEALDRLSIEQPDLLPDNVNVVDYVYDKERFKSDIRKLIELLKSFNL
jgi:hypothetical protein